MNILMWMIGLTGLVLAESISNLNQNITKGNQSASSTTRTYQPIKEQSGYNTQVHIIGSEKKFDRIRFVPSLFNRWTALYIEAQTFDLIEQLNTQGYVNANGTLKETVTTLSVPLIPNQVISKQKIQEYYQNKYPSQWVVSALKKVGVLDSDGFLVNTDSFSDEFNGNDFKPYKKQISKIDFNFSTQAVQKAFETELLRVLKESSTMIHITQEQTTRYQSRQDNFVDGFLDQLGGDLLGKVFYKDTIQTVKRKGVYSPNMDPFWLFSNITFGFSSAPYAHGAPGNMIFYGQKKQSVLSVDISNQTGQSHLQLGTYQWQTRTQSASLPQEMIQFGGWQVTMNDLHDTKDQLLWASGGWLFGNRQARFDQDIFVGLGAYSSRLTGDVKLGLSLGYGGVYHVVRHLGVYYGIQSQFGFDFTKESGMSWMVNVYELGLKTAWKQFEANVGYQWVAGQNGTHVFDGLKLGLGLYL